MAARAACRRILYTAVVRHADGPRLDRLIRLRQVSADVAITGHLQYPVLLADLVYLILYSLLFLLAAEEFLTPVKHLQSVVVLQFMGHLGNEFQLLFGAGQVNFYDPASLNIVLKCVIVFCCRVLVSIIGGVPVLM